MTEKLQADALGRTPTPKKAAHQPLCEVTLAIEQKWGGMLHPKCTCVPGLSGESMPEKESQSIKSDRLSKSSLARMAGNIAAGLVTVEYQAGVGLPHADLIAYESVRLAKLIAKEINND